MRNIAKDDEILEVMFNDYGKKAQGKMVNEAFVERGFFHGASSVSGLFISAGIPPLFIDETEEQIGMLEGK